MTSPKTDKKEPRKGKPADQRGGDSSGKKRPPLKDPSRTVLMWFLIFAVVIIGLQLVNRFGTMQETKISYSQFKRLLADTDVRLLRARVVQRGLNEAELHGEVDDPGSLESLQGVKHTPGVTTFVVNLPFIDSEMLKEWDSHGFVYTFEPERLNWGDVLLSTVPWLLIMVLFWVFMVRQMQAGQRGIFSFAKSRAKFQNIDRPSNTFKEAAGVDEAKAELQEIIEFLKDPDKFKKLGGKIPKGVLLLGPPGTGKTLLARCVAGEAGVPFLSMSGSDFVEMFVGVGASRVRDLFETAKKSSPCIIFIDEIDAVGRQRGAGLGGGHDEREQTLNQMLVEMDGFEVNSGVILIAATNRPDVLDPALLRPGRFDRRIVVDMPDIKGREGILAVHTKGIPLAPDVNLNTIARGTPGFVGADLANLVNEAALTAARFGQGKVTMLDFEEAKDKVLMGTERKSMVLSDKEKRNTAYHESGHAICNFYCKEADPLHKVTIIPRGRALGVTASLPIEDKHSHTRGYLLDRVCIMMGGRVAEEMIFGTQTTGAANDIAQATEMVRKLVCDFGMTEQLGPVSYGEKNQQVFLGREITRHRDYSDKTADQIDRVMRKTIEEQMERAKRILTEHRDQLDRLAAALLEHELLDLEEVRKVMAGDVLSGTRKTRTPPAGSTDGEDRKEPVTSSTPANDRAGDGAETSESDTTES